MEDIGIVRNQPTLSVGPAKESTPDFLEEIALIPLKTPSRGQELRRSSRKLAATDTIFNFPSQRLFTRKASKALDQQANKIANLEAQVAYLTTKLEKKAKNVRKKVILTPGQRFIRMADICKAKRQLRGRVVYEDEASDVEVMERELTDTEECIQAVGT